MSEALKLADLLESNGEGCACECACGASWAEYHLAEAAAELRRLHRANEILNLELSDEKSQCVYWKDKSRAQQETLRLALEALQSLGGVGAVIQWKGQWELCNEAIVKIKEVLCP